MAIALGSALVSPGLIVFHRHICENCSVMPLGEKLLLRLAKRSDQPELGATANYNIENALDFVRNTVPDFDQLVKSKTVLDYGCGHGWQAVAMKKLCGAEKVFGLDVVDRLLSFGTALAQTYGCSDYVTFGKEIPVEMVARFDLVLSSSAFEHYREPEVEIQRMRNYVKPSGLIIVTFAEPWYSHSGSHFSGYTRFPGTGIGVPWLNLVFSDEALLTLRSKFRRDLPNRLEDIEGGLNRMTISKFEQIIGSSGMDLVQKRLFATKNIPLVTKIPVVREFLTSAACAILRKSV